MLQHVWSLLLSTVMLAAAPATSNYRLSSFGFGSGGTADSGTANYSLSGITGEVSGDTTQTANYAVKPGQTQTKQANVPTVTLSNPSQYYNKLKVVIGPEGNPTDAKFAIAISSDNFATTRYVQNDNTVASTLGAEDYQTYSLWGGSGGALVIGLQPGTTYKVKAKAVHGAYTESGYGPESTAATVEPSLSFALTTDLQSSPPFSLAFSDLLASTIVDAPQKIWADFATNGDSGGMVYIAGQNAGLKSLASSYTLASATADLAAAQHGYGAQNVSITQTSGGPFTVEAPYNGTAATVGVMDTSIRPIYKTTGPIAGGRAATLLKAKSSPLTPAAADYTEVLTLIASASF